MQRRGPGRLLGVVSFLCVFVLGLGLGAWSPLAQGATIAVNSLADNTTTGDGNCTLREAINNANSDSDTSGGDCAAGTGDDTITFSVSGTITLGSALPTIVSTATAGKLTIDGSGQSITVSGNDSVRVFAVASGAELTLNSLTVSHGKTGSSGGAISSGGTVTVTNATFSHNSATVDGGAILSAGTLTVQNSTFTDNAAKRGGAILIVGGSVTITNSTFADNNGSLGAGGIQVQAGSTVTIQNSTFSGNSGTSGGAISNVGTVTITNSTFSHNSATGDGGAISNSDNNGTVTITNATFSGNAAGGDGGGIFNFSSGTVTIKNSIVADSPSGGNCFNDNSSTFTTLGVNFDTDATCPGFTQKTSAQLKLGPLADNGGPTQTHALGAGSVAIDAAAGCPPPNTDQRGVARPQGSACDVGAYEAQLFTLTVQGAGTGNGTVTNSGINCTSTAGTTSGDCSETVPEGTVITLTATADPGSTFVGWTGCDSPSGDQCQMTLDADKTVTAAFDLTTVAGDGDVNGDGVANIIDARICLRFALDLISLDASEQQTCDVDGDGDVDRDDAVEIAKFDIDLPSALAAGLRDVGLRLGLGLLALAGLGLLAFREKPWVSASSWFRRSRRELVSVLLIAVGLVAASCGVRPLPPGASAIVARLQEDTLVISVRAIPGGGLAAFSAGTGGFTFDPKRFEVMGLEAAPGWDLLASQIDNAAGEVCFALVNPTGGTETGPVLTLTIRHKSLGKAGLEWDPAALVLGDANDQEIAVDGVTFLVRDLRLPTTSTETEPE